LTTHSPEETQNIGRTLGAQARAGHVFLLDGELGAGKTCLTQGVLWGLGGNEYARSPSYVLVSQYQARMTMYHIDLYRLGRPGDAMDLGLDEYLDGDGLAVVEWADRVPGLFQADHLSIRFERLGEADRRLTLSATTPGYADLLDAAREGPAPG
jgi:tRNA threonylcarbamoyladenosine biosynthesis protein TsaE